MTAFVLTYFAIPKIIVVAKLKNIFDEPDNRKTHKQNIPTLGGLAIFAGTIFSICFYTNSSFEEMRFIISGLLLLFYVGLKDDIIQMAAYKKLIAQIIAAVIVVYFGGIRINTFYGLFGVYELHPWISVPFSILTIIVITNAFNLIDGIDGLAGTISFLTCFVFGTWFFMYGNQPFYIPAYAVCGSILGFLIHNWHPAKIFMGDTGSLIVGFVNSILAIEFIETNRLLPSDEPMKVFAVPVVTIAILWLPLFDTLRVVMIRLSQGKSPLSPDRNHLHHMLVDNGFSHAKSTITLLLINSTFVLFAFTFQKWRGETLLIFLSILMLLVTLILKFICRKKLNGTLQNKIFLK